MEGKIGTQNLQPCQEGKENEVRLSFYLLVRLYNYVTSPNAALPCFNFHFGLLYLGIVLT